ncbi:LPXTG cell wall anchor domain-containing protein [Mageeibacillus indolicus]|uniref:LPXTG cell wall anchor domain-containing protein n=1 Tax=Mageeibacillus indolicus TaxID=884684 RepID=UPI0009DA2D2A
MKYIPKPKKQVHALPKTGESISFGWLFFALGILLTGFAVVCKKKIMECGRSID